VALSLLADHGYDATSMDRIAEAVGISADDLVRTIGDKDTIVLNVARDMLAAVVAELATADAQAPVVEALLDAHVAVLNQVIDGNGPITYDEMRWMGKAITSSADLQKKVSAQRADMLTDVLAERFGATVSDRRVQRGLKLWSAVLAATYMDVLDRQGRFDPDVDAETPQQMRDRLNRAYRILIGRPASRSE
jgi:AcrR family transcriptional regulator